LQEIKNTLLRSGFSITEKSERHLVADKLENHMVRSHVSVSVQDVGQLKFFMHGWLQVRETIGSETFWEAVGREVGPKGIFPASSNISDGWVLAQEQEASAALQRELLIWLKVNGSLDRLLDIVETLYFEGEKIPLPKTKKGISQIILEEIGVRSSDREDCDVIFRPKYAQLLANLYLSLDDFEKALFYTEKWIELRGHENVDPAYHALRKKLLSAKHSA